MDIYVVRFFSWAAWSVLFAFMPLWLLDGALFDAAHAGAITATAALANRAGALFFVGWINRASVRRAVIVSQLGLIVGALAMSWLAAARSAHLPSWMAASLVFGLSSSVATLAQVTCIARHFPAAEKLKAFSRENVALNLSAGLSPLASSVLLARFAQLYGLAPILFAAVSIVLTAGISFAGSGQAARASAMPSASSEPSAPSAPAAPPAARPDADTDTTSDRAGKTLFIALNFLIFFAFTQFYNVFPVYAHTTLGTQRTGLMFAASSALIVLLQVPASRLAARRKAITLALLANGCMAAGVAGLYFAPGHASAACVAVLLLTVSEIIFGPLYQSMSVKIFPGKPAYAMGILMFVWALAETTATFVGIRLVGRGHAPGAFGMAAAGCGVAMFVLVVQYCKFPASALARLMRTVP